MKACLAILLVGIASPAFSQTQCTLSQERAIGVTTDRVLSQVELFLPDITADELAFFNAEHEAMTKRIFARKDDPQRNRYVMALNNYDVWSFRNSLKEAQKHKEQFAQLRVPVTKGQLVRVTSVLPMLLHSISQRWDGWFLSSKLKKIDSSIALQVRNDLDVEIINWSMFLQACGSEIG